MMARKPLDIPWNVLMPNAEGPAPMVEVIPSGGATATSTNPGGRGGLLWEDTFPVGDLTHHELVEKIERLRQHIASGFPAKLPDKGAKLLASVRRLQEELERRSLPSPGKDKDEEQCREIKWPASVCSLDSIQNISSNARSSNSKSFAHHFSKLLDVKADGAHQDAYGEELRVMHKEYKDHSHNLSALGEKRNSTRILSRTSPFQGPRNVTSKNKRKCCHGHQKGVASLGSSSLHLGKRRRYLRGHGSLGLKSTKDVVMLDEDVQTIEQIQEEDAPVEQLPPSIKEAKIYYPSRDHSESVEIFQSDIKCLKPESYLSSTIMNFYILYLQNSITSSGRPRGEYHFCNTYFYSKLEEAISHKGETDEHLTKLRRWWKGVNIFDKAYIFLPIHRDLHWSLVIICIPAKEDESGPIILHLDSLGFHASRMIFDNIERYLKGEWKYLTDTGRHLDPPFSENIWINLPRRINKKRIVVPQQKNHYDCGLFVLYFIQRFIEAAPARLRREDLAMFGSKWFHPEEASGLRRRLKELILEEFVRIDNHERESPESHVSSLED